LHRIIFDARSVVKRRSGIGNYAEALLEELVPLASDLRFLVLRNLAFDGPRLRHERVEELAFHHETKSVRSLFTSPSTLRRFAGFDLYHSPADIVPLGLGCPWVVTLHDLMWIEAPELASAFAPVRAANALWYRWNFRRAIQGARRVLAISHATADAIARIYPQHASKVDVVHHGIDHDRYSPERAGPRSSIDKWIPPDVRYSLIVGQGSPYKNHARMVEAFVEATAGEPRHRLILVRRFSRVDFPMNELLARPTVRQKVLTLPFVSDSELLTLYRHARMLLFASLYEGFGLPALEAMCLGTPVLASTAPAVLEVTGDAAHHANPYDRADLVRKIRELDHDEALRAELRAAGPRRAREFSWRRCAELTLQTYRRALA
jgi:glycosyltransferase involved in cell wall biosynthesis